MELLCVGACGRPARTIYRGMALCADCFLSAMHPSAEGWTEARLVAELRAHHVLARDEEAKRGRAALMATRELTKPEERLP